MANDNLTPDDLERYARQMNLPQITPAQQLRLKNTRVCVVGAGGLSAPMLPYLAGAGVGHITIIDDDTVSRSNLHRQTIYADAKTGQNKAEMAAQYLAALNPAIDIHAIEERLTVDNAHALEGFDLLIDGSDNFETKTLLNDLSLATQTPLLGASVQQFAGQIGLFAGYLENAPCYACLFPELPKTARNCNEAGILGTAAGICGTYQAHIALGFLLGLEGFAPGLVISLDMLRLRTTKLHLAKDENCPACAAIKTVKDSKLMPNHTMPPVVHPSELQGEDVVIIDVRTDAEVAASPIPGALHMELSTIPTRYTELPHDKRLAFACAANVRSAQAAYFVQSMGYENVCVYDVLAA